jgi:hypothetical protein
MPITLDISGKNMKIKVLRGLDFEELRDKVKLLSGKKPMYSLIDGQSKFDYWEVPVSQFGNLLSHIAKERILLQSEAAKALMSKYSMDTAGLLELPPITKEIKWKRPPRFPEQEQYIRINEAKQKMVLAPAPGLGKSGMSLMRAQVLGATRVLVVGPSKSNYTTWRAEVDKTTDWTTIEYHGTTAKRKKIRESENFLQANVVYTTYTMAHELVGFPFEQVICDEAHTICHSNTKLFKNIKKLMKSLPEAGLQLLSGTPIQHKPQDYWALTHLVNEMIAGDEGAWQKMYEKVEKTIIKKVPVKTANGYALDEFGRVKLRKIEIPTKTSPQNIEHLSGRIKPFTFRLKRDKFVDFEDRTDIQLVPMLPRQLEMYRQAKEDLYLELSTGQLKLSKEAFGRLTRFLQICEGCFNLDENVHDSGKFDYLYSQLDAAKDKRIVWGRFKPGSHILYEKYKDRASIYNGDFTQIQKNVALWNFQGCETKQDLEDWKKYNKTKFTEPGQADFLFATIDRGCTAGLNLDKCSKQYFTSFSWAGNINDQTSARVKRLNQLAEEVYTEFIITEGWEEQALALTFRNLAVTLDILDGKSDISYQQIQSLINKL